MRDVLDRVHIPCMLDGLLLQEVFSVEDTEVVYIKILEINRKGNVKGYSVSTNACVRILVVLIVYGMP